MKKAIFKDAKTNIDICHRIEEDPTGYVAHCVATNHWGKAERWVQKKRQVDVNGVPTTVYPEETYADADVVQEELRTIVLRTAYLNPETQQQVPAVTEQVAYAKLPAEYIVEIVDLNLDPTYLLEVCHKSRKAAYPSLGDFADAYVHLQNGDSSPMAVYVAACNAVKTQYPKP